MSKRLSFSIAVNLLTENFKKGTNTVKNSLRSMQMQVITFAAALGAGGLGISGLLSRFRDVARETSRVMTALKNVSGGTKGFADNLRFVNDLAKKYGLEINALVGNFAKFTASATQANMPMEQQKKVFESVSRAITAFGLSASESDGVMLALSQMMSKGKLSMEELRKQMGEKLPVAMQAMAKALGVSIGQMEKLIGKGKVMSADVLPKFADALNEMIPNVDTDNLETSLSRLSNMFGKIVDASGFQNKYKALIDGLTSLLESASKNIQNIIVGIVAAIGFVVTRGLTKVHQGHVNTGNMIVANAQSVRNKMIASAQSRIIAENKLEDLKLQHAQATGAKQVQLANQIEKQKQLVSAKTLATNKLHEEAKALNAQVSAAKANTYWGRAYLGMNVAAKKLMASIKSMWNSFAPAIIISGLIALGGYIKDLYDKTKWLEKATEDYNKDLATEQTNINILFNRLRKATEGTEDYNKIKNEILSKYGEYLKGLSDEVKSLKDVEGAYKAISAAALQAAKDRAISKNSDAAYDKYTSSLASNATELQKRLSDKFGKEKGTAIYDDILQSLNEDKDLPQDIQKVVDGFNKTYYGSSATGFGSSSHNPVGQLVNNIRVSKRQLNEELEGIKSAFGEISGTTTNDDPIIPTKPDTDPDNKALRAAEKRLEALRKLEESDRQRKIDKLNFDNDMRQKSINNMEDGFQKEAEQLRLNYDKELQTVEEYKVKIRKAQLDEVRNQFIGGGGDPKKFESYLKTVDLESVLPQGLKPSDIEAHVAQMMDAANAGFIAGENKLNKEIEAFRNENRLRFASDIDRQLSSIDNYYNERILRVKKGSDDEKQLIDNRAKEKQEAVLQSIGKQLEFELQYNQKVKELLSDRYVFESDKRRVSLEQQIKDQKRIFNNLEKQVLNDPHNNELARQLKDAYIQLKLLNKELEKTKIEKLKEIFSDASEVFSSLRSTLDDFGIKFSDDINKALDGMGQTIDGLASIDVTKPVSIITGGLKALGGVAKTVSGIFGSADYSEYNKLKEKYENLLSIWDELIDKKKEYLSTSVADEVSRVEKETLELINKQTDATKKLAQARLDSGSSAGSHSMWHRMWKGSYKFDGKNWRDVAGEISNELGISFNSMSDMLNMTSDQLQWIKENYSGLWSVMDGEFRGYLEQIIQYGDQAIEVIKQAKEAITGVSFDNLKDSFLNTLTDMNSDAKDFADDFSSYLQKAILKAMLDKAYTKRLEDWYDAFADANRDGSIDTSEYNKLQNEWNDIVNSALADRDKLKDLFGWESTDSPSQSPSKGYSVSMDQDTGDKILGRVTAMQMSGIKMEGLLSAISIDTANIFKHTANMNSEMAKQNNILNNIYQVQRNSFFEVEGTGKYLKDMNGKLSNIETYTKALE